MRKIAAAFEHFFFLTDTMTKNANGTNTNMTKLPKAKEQRSELPHFFDLREGNGELLGEADKRGSLVCADPHQGQTVLLGGVHGRRDFAEVVLVEIRQTERRRQGLGKVQPFPGAADLEEPRRKLPGFVRSLRLERGRRGHQRPVWRSVDVVEDVVTQAGFEGQLLLI